jgi:hypothetical protein
MLNVTTLVHEGRQFKNETVYMTGNSFYDCKFLRCTLVIREGGISNLVGCTFECCNWHIDILITDHHRWDSFLKTMAPLIRGSVPRSFAETQQQEDDQ